jgi:hypothetical protein
MKTITLKKACEILDKADAVIVNDNTVGRISTPLQYIQLAEDWQDIIQAKDCDSYFLILGDTEQDNDAICFSAEHNTQVKIDSDGDLLLCEQDKSAPIKISVLTKKNLKKI